MPLDKSQYHHRIEAYFSGKLTEQEKFNLEKEALDDPFLQDAMDGFSDHKDGLKHFQARLQKKRINWNTYLGIGLAGLTIVALIFMLTRPEGKETINQNKNLAINTENIGNKTQAMQEGKTVEVIPEAIESLTEIQVDEQIDSDILVDDFSHNETYPENKPAKHDETITIDIKNLDLPEPKVALDLPKKAKRTIYPYIYFYDLAVVDYTRFENRVRTFKKTTYVFSGLDASQESHESKELQEQDNETHMIEKTVEVKYMDYLEETMYYVSKNKYKNALKRFNLITKQYKDDINAYFYGGLCYYNLGDFESALKEFEAIIDLKDSPFLEEALWYKVKTLLKLNETETAKGLLLDIIAYQGFYSEYAFKLLEELE